ncbi:PREDICTED: auxin efflux carrier component 1a-like isoform X2 [Nelumbo nucifera]|uniref:Auxin efflux carrier component n=1 Tax=Nelumbo nucifera TaxID=4432 RepID=A0A1U8AY73_NELNU|nr:PREDICTED: auxin efflux carrier component 1a-like isoform X2 [Nelumbo nucifera]
MILYYWSINSPSSSTGESQYLKKQTSLQQLQDYIPLFSHSPWSSTALPRLVITSQKLASPSSPALLLKICFPLQQTQRTQIKGKEGKKKMISFSDLYCVLSSVVPLYVTMFLAYASVKWWNVFTPDQCAGINKFVAIFAVPLLSFEFISRINPYKMNLLFIAADSVSKVVILIVLFSWAKLSKRGSLDWVITLFSLSTLPNTLVMGIPLLKSMYGSDKENLMVQVVVLQCIIWYTLMLFLFEYREARILVLQKFDGGDNTEKHGEDVSSAQKVRSSSSGSAGLDQDEVVHVIVTRPSSGSPQSDTQSTLQNLNKVAPDSRRFNQMFATAAAAAEDGVPEQSVEVSTREEANDNKGKSTREADEKSQVLQAPDDHSSNMSSVMFKLILKMVWFKLIKNPNSYASLLGLSWALASCRWSFKKPQIIENSVTILSNAGLGMAMFSLGLFMALQPRIIACGNRLAAYGMLMRFVVGPAVMAVASIAVGLRGTVLRVSIVQAALPQGIVPFVFAREYNLHPDVLSTAVIFGMIISLPITVLYYVFLGL